MIVLRKNSILTICIIVIITTFTYLGVDGLFAADDQMVWRMRPPLEGKVIVVDARAW